MAVSLVDPQTAPSAALRAAPEAKLQLAEAMLASVSLEDSARQGLDWIATHVGVQQAVCAVVDATSRYLISIAEHGLVTTAAWEFSVELDNVDHPLVSALARRAPLYWDAATKPPWCPFESTPFSVLPVRFPDGDVDLADGLLLVATNGQEVHPDIHWFLELLGQQVSRLRSRHTMAESRARRERMLLYSSINAVTDPILLTDQEGKLMIANARAEKLLTAPDDASEGWRQAVALNNMLFSAALSSSTMGVDEPSRRREILLVDPIEGSDLLFELLSSVSKDPREGTFVVSVLRNVTDLGLAKQEIEESQRKLRLAQTGVREERHRLELIIDSVADPILVTDPAGDIVLMNAPAERLLTVPRGGSEQTQRHVQANGAYFSSFVSSLLTSGSDRRWRSEISLLDPETGASMPVEASAGKILSEQGELTWVVTILHDRTEAMEKARLFEQVSLASKELEQKVQEATAELAHQNELLRRQALELEQASALKTQFLANMSHEFRTPLNAILGYTQMLLHGIAGRLPAAHKRSLARIDSNGRHLLALVSDILDISRIEAGRMPLNLRDFELPALVQEVRAELDPIVSRSNLKVRTDLPARLPVMRSDRQKVKQILVNLLSNAIKFTHQGWVEISVAHLARTGRISISVTDTGIGIAPEDQEHVFEDFRQLDSSTSRQYGGTGLGLSICRRLAHTLGGRISVRSDIAKGSTFTLDVPIRLRKGR